MFLDDIFNGYNPGAFEGGATSPTWPQAGGSNVFQNQAPGANLLQNQAGGSPYLGGIGSIGGGLGMLGYAQNPLGGAAMNPLLSGGMPMAKPGAGMGMLGRFPTGNNRMRSPRNWQQMQQLQQALGGAFGPMSLGRMGMNAY